MTDTIEGAESLSNTLDYAGAKADLAAAVTFLADHESQISPTGGEDKNVAVVGFSLGAYYALHLSDVDPRRISAVVRLWDPPGDYNRSRAVYLGHFAENDEFEPQSEVDALEDALRDAGRLVTFYRYHGTGHWFFEPDRPDAYAAAAAELAWDRTLRFLKICRTRRHRGQSKGQAAAAAAASWRSWACSRKTMATAKASINSCGIRVCQVGVMPG